MARRPGFPGYDAAAFEFLGGLAANNEKPWFEAHRDAYETHVKAPSAALVTAVADALREAEVPLEGVPKRSGFRIHRDVRFSKDKSPYKTAVGSVWYRQGSGKDGAGVLYFHLAPGACFTAAAFYMPQPEVLDAIRERIRVHPEQFAAVVAALGDAGLTLDPASSLSRMPKGFEDLAGSPMAASLKLKSFVVRRPISDAVVRSGKLVPQIVAMGRDALPLLRFGWAAVDEVAA